MQIPEGSDSIPVCMTDFESFLKIKRDFQPTHIIHSAGVCDLDVCEERPQWAESLNTGGAKVITDVFGDRSHILFVSSDLVFSGDNPPVNGYNENDTPDPVSVVGKTMEWAEIEINRSQRNCIVRLGLPIGDSIGGDKGAIDFIANRLKRGLPLTLFHDEFRSCISCTDIAQVVDEISERETEGVYHAGGPLPVSLHQIGLWVVEKRGYDGSLLKGISRFDELMGPPRIGNVSLNSSKIKNLINFEINAPINDIVNELN
jgi:dTDP-4-dehydrorhamnose reductase